MPLSEFTTCKPISPFQTHSSCGGSRSKAFVRAAGGVRRLRDTEVSKYLIATNFKWSCPKYTLEGPYQRAAFQGDCSPSELVIYLVPASIFCKRFNSSIFSCRLQQLRQGVEEDHRAGRRWLLRKESLGKGHLLQQLRTDLGRPCTSNTSARSASSERICSWPLLSGRIVSALATHQPGSQSASN